MKDKRAWAYCAIAAAQAALLWIYFRRTGVGVTPAELLGSFRWLPPHAEVSGARLFAVWGMIGAGVVVAGLWLALAAGAGAALLSRLSWRATDPLQHGLASIALGLGLLSLTLFALASLHLVYPAAALALALGLLAFNARRWRGLEPRLPRPGRFGEGAGPLAAAAALGAVLLAFHLIGAFVPPSSFDEMDYQLSLPKIYLLNHGFVDTPFSHFSYFPKNINLLFLLGLVSGGPIVAKLLAWALCVLATLALYSLAAPEIGRRAAALAAAVYFFTPVIGNQFRIAAPDVGTAFFELVGLSLLLDWLDKRRRATLLLSATLWGLALGSKYTAAPDFAAAVVALAWLLRRERPGASARALAAFCAAAALVWSPWLVKNFVASGNPVNPIFSTFFKSRNFYFAGRYQAMVDYSVGLGIPNYFPLSSWRDVLLLPWRLIVSHNDYNHDLGPVWLLLAPLAALSWGRRAGPRLRAILLVCALAWAGWLCLSIHITRYFAGGLALTSVAAGWLLDAACERGRWRWALLAPVLFAWLAQSARMVVIQNGFKKPWAYLAGGCSLGEYIDEVLPDSPYDAFAYLNETAPLDARVLVFNEFRTFYLDRDFLASTPWDHDYWLEILRESATPADALARLKAKGLTYFLANDNFRAHQTGMARSQTWTPEDLDKERRFLHEVLRPVYRSGGVWVARVRAGPQLLE